MGWLRIPLLLALAPLALAAGRPVYAGEPPDLAAYPWFYQREGRPIDPGEELVELVAVGDVMLGRGVAATTPDPLAGVTPWLAGADLALGNLEGVIGAAAAPEPGITSDPAGPYRLRAPVGAVDLLQAAGFDLLGLANNHALDFGPASLEETAQQLQAAGITPVGAGPTVESAQATHFRQAGSLRLAFLAFNAVPDPAGPAAGVGWQPAQWDQAQALAAISAARTEADAVIVSVHWGREYALTPDPAQVASADLMLAAGADLVVGHHPHAVQGPARLQAGRVVLYSLGNFVFDQEFDPARQGLALRAFFDRQGLRAVQLLPVRAGLQPGLLPPDEAAPLLARVRPASRLGFRCDPETCRLVDSPPPPGRSGLFWGGEIDLTGDGRQEKIRRTEERAVIYSAGAEVWRSDPAWRVVDLALGDPNDDGRWEALLALWKLDETGVERSHPFIIGFRWGIYRDIWGGSAVVDSIYEVELGDVDGNGSQELIVLEGAPQNDRAVSVWDWHGWGFSLRWRSPAGPYRDLVFIPAAEGRPALISVAN